MMKPGGVDLLREGQTEGRISCQANLFSLAMKKPSVVSEG